MAKQLPISVEVNGSNYEGMYEVKGRDPIYIIVSSPLGRKPGSPGSLPVQAYAEGILREIVREAIRRSKGSTV